LFIGQLEVHAIHMGALTTAASLPGSGGCKAHWQNRQKKLSRWPTLTAHFKVKLCGLS
jgi:hypothetical protein